MTLVYLICLLLWTVVIRSPLWFLVTFHQISAPYWTVCSKPLLASMKVYVLHTRTRQTTLLLQTFYDPLSGTTQVSRYQKDINHSGFCWSRHDGVAVASAEPYTSYLHFTPEDNHANTSSVRFLRAGCHSWHQTNSVNALNDSNYTVLKKITPPNLQSLLMQPLMTSEMMTESMLLCRWTTSGTFTFWACHESHKVVDKESVIRFVFLKMMYLYH